MFLFDGYVLLERPHHHFSFPFPNFRPVSFYLWSRHNRVTFLLHFFIYSRATCRRRRRHHHRRHRRRRRRHRRQCCRHRCRH